MGKLVMLQEADDARIERLKRVLGIGRKVDVIRAGLDRLEADAEQAARSARWRRAAGRATVSSRRVNADFRSHSRIKRSE
jgi:hypothetical protein